jgi:rhamnosyl/mannosyltransferase
MKILQIGKFYHPYSGGIETVLKGLAEGLVQRGDQVTVLCSSHCSRSSEEWIEGVRVIRAGTMATLLSQPISPRLIHEIVRNSGDYDLIHFHSPNPLAELAGMFSRAKTPKVITYHSDIVRQKIARKLYWPIFRKFLTRTDRILVATDAHIQHSAILPAYADHCSIIPFALDPEASRITQAPDAQILDEAQRLRKLFGTYILFVGRLVPYKGLTYLLQAMKEIPSSLVIVGNGPQYESLEQEARALGISERVHFAKNVEIRRDLIAYFLGAELFVLPSINESEAFGMVLLEALACGKPLVTTRIRSGVNFVNQEGVTGHVAEPEDPKSLAQKITQILIQPELKTSFANAARERYERVFNPDRMIDSHRELYQSIINRVQISASSDEANPR